jgi:hypothetical protein
MSTNNNTYTESGLILQFPDENHFRFATCKGYTEIQDHFKEMDVCWYDAKEDLLYLIGNYSGSLPTFLVSMMKFFNFD